MKKGPRGYTIVEVLLVLAISSVLFLGVTTIFGSGRKNTEFSQAIYDIQSKVKQYAVQVSTGNFLETTQYTCAQSPSSLRATLTLGASASTNSNQDCIYLGKALLPVIGSSDIYVYDVLGLRNAHNGITDTGLYVKNVGEAMPEPAGSRDAGNAFTYLFTDKYTLANGTKILSAKTNGTPGGILKIYSTFQNNNTTSRGITAYSNTYTYQAGDEQASGFAETNARLRNCIEEVSTCVTATDLTVNGWQLCIQTDSAHQGILTVKPSSNGLITKVTITSCT
jgi:prepilin-type N-terminal cleavage/methylation domain-containing protein